MKVLQKLENWRDVGSTSGQLESTICGPTKTTSNLTPPTTSTSTDGSRSAILRCGESRDTPDAISARFDGSSSGSSVETAANKAEKKG